MKIRVVVDNNTLIDQYYYGEPGLCFLLEDDDKNYLFDAGYSDLFLSNLQKMGYSLDDIDAIILSHGHNDHSGGLRYLNKRMKLIYHPDADKDKYYQGELVSIKERFEDLNLELCPQRKVYKISDHLTFLGEIPRTVQKDRHLDNDLLWDDTALVYEKQGVLYIITACSHSGICNIIDYARKVCHSDKIGAIIGGFHLLNNKEETAEVCSYLKENKIPLVYPCHCTDLGAKIALAEVCEVREIGVSSLIEF